MRRNSIQYVIDDKRLNFYFTKEKRAQRIPYIVIRDKYNEISFQKMSPTDIAEEHEIVYLANDKDKAILKPPENLNSAKYQALYKSFENELNFVQLKEQAQIDRFIRRILVNKTNAFTTSSALIKEEKEAEAEAEARQLVLQHEFILERSKILKLLTDSKNEGLAYDKYVSSSEEVDPILTDLIQNLDIANEGSVAWRNVIINKISQLEEIATDNKDQTLKDFVLFVKEKFNIINDFVDPLKKFEIGIINSLPVAKVNKESAGYSELVTFFQEKKEAGLNISILGGRAALTSSEDKIDDYTKALSTINAAVKVDDEGNIVFNKALAQESWDGAFSEEARRMETLSDRLENYPLFKKFIFNHSVRDHLLQDKEIDDTFGTINQLPLYENIEDEDKPGIYHSISEEADIEDHIDKEIKKHRERIAKYDETSEFKNKPYAFYLALNNASGPLGEGGSHWISAKVIVNPLRKTIYISYADSMPGFRFFKPDSIKVLSQSLENKFKGEGYNYKIKVKENKKSIKQNNLWACGYISIYNILKEVAPNHPISLWDQKNIDDLRVLVHKAILENISFFENHPSIQNFKDDKRLMKISDEDLFSYQFTPQLIAKFLSDERPIIDIDLTNDNYKNYRIDFGDFFNKPFDLKNIKVVEVPANENEIVNEGRRRKIAETAKMILKLQHLPAHEIQEKLKINRYSLDLSPKVEIENIQPIDENCKVRIDNIDCIEVAQGLVKKYGPDVALLNMANDGVVLGGLFLGAIAQEEEVARRSDLMLSLLAHAHRTGGYFNENNKRPTYGIGAFGQTEVFTSKNTMYNNREAFSVNVITSASLQKNGGISQNQYHDKESGFYSDKVGRAIQAAKIYNQIKTAILGGNKAIVLSAFGCGAFKNPPNDVAELYKEILSLPEFIGKIEVHFAIISDKNDKKNKNFKSFDDVFAGRLEVANQAQINKVMNPIFAISQFEENTKSLTQLLDELTAVISYQTLDETDRKNYRTLRSELNKLRNKIREFYVENYVENKDKDLLSEFAASLNQSIQLLATIGPNQVVIDIYHHLNLYNQDKTPLNIPALPKIEIHTFDDRLDRASRKLDEMKHEIVVVNDNEFFPEETIEINDDESQDDISEQIHLLEREPEVDRSDSRYISFPQNPNEESNEEEIRPEEEPAKPPIQGLLFFLGNSREEQKLRMQIHMANAKGTPWDNIAFESNPRFATLLSFAEEQKLQLLPITTTDQKAFEADLDELKLFVQNGGELKNLSYTESERSIEAPYVSLADDYQPPADTLNIIQRLKENPEAVKDEVMTIRDPISRPNFEKQPYLDLNPLYKNRLIAIWRNKSFMEKRDWERSLQAEYDVIKYITDLTTRSRFTGTTKKVKRSILPTGLNTDLKALKLLLDNIKKEPHYQKPLATTMRNAVKKWSYQLLEYANDRGDSFLHVLNQDFKNKQIRKAAYAGNLAHQLLQVKSKKDLHPIIESINDELITLNASDSDSELIKILNSMRNEIITYKLKHPLPLYSAPKLTDITTILQNVNDELVPLSSLSKDKNQGAEIISVTQGLGNGTDDLDTRMQNLVDSLFSDGENLQNETSEKHHIKRLCGVALGLCESKNKTYQQLGERLKEKFLTAEIIEEFRTSAVCRVQLFITRLLEVNTSNQPQKNNLINELSHLTSGLQSFNDKDISYYFHNMVKITKDELKQKQPFVYTLFAKPQLRSFLEENARLVPKVPFDYIPSTHLIRPQDMKGASNTADFITEDNPLILKK